MKKPMFRVGDALSLLLVLCLSALLLVFFFTSDQGSTAEILVEGEVIETLSLATDTVKTVTSRGITLEIAVENGEIFVREASCDDRVCQHTSAISKRGTTIVCAPAAVVIRITGGGDGDADFTAG